jgi:hypothetical protein
MAIQIGTVADAISGQRRRRFDEGSFRGVADYLFETLPGEEPGPQALIARQAPGWTLPAHFHMQHQFQVVLRGSGTLGSHELLPGSVHYTSPQSGYGPIVAGPDGLDYFTLRVLTDKGAWYLPQSRPFMKPGLFKEQKWGVAAAQATFAILIPPREDGLAAWSWQPHEGETIACDTPHDGAGRFHLVIRGRFLLGKTELVASSCVYAPADETPVFRALDADGCLVVVQFPRQALDTKVPPELRAAPSPRGEVIGPAES